MRELLLQGPGKNALGIELIRNARRQIAEAAGEPLLVTGAGDAFSAGLNLKEVLALDESTIEPFIRELDGFFGDLYHYAGPTVALINGHAIAGGCIVSLCCDHRVSVASPAVKIGINEVVVGVQFPPLALRIVRARVPTASIHRVMLGGVLVSPDEALRLGLIDEVSEDAAALARRRLDEFSAHMPRAYAATKLELRGRRPTDAEIDDELRELLPPWTSEEVKRGIAARLKR
ncbi:MAG: enoyl-CoA hydratase/isomerase family protein [Polyangiaceae bacterium]